MPSPAESVQNENQPNPAGKADDFSDKSDIFSEILVWKAIGAGWKPLRGKFAGDGFSVEWHELGQAKMDDWGASFHPQSLEICINISGSARLEHDGQTLEIGPRSLAFYSVGEPGIDAIRTASRTGHSFMTIELGVAELGQLLGSSAGAAHPLIADAVSTGSFTTGLGRSKALYAEQDQWIRQLLEPPVPQAAERLWVRGRLMEILAQSVFDGTNQQTLFCDRQKNLARERVEKAIEVLRQNLVEPLRLEELGRRVGCSQYYLSRTFSKETGSTIQQYLRRLRIEWAAELLKSGRFNVTEAALEVGYNSMSHFSQAFCHEMGVCPALYQKQKPR